MGQRDSRRIIDAPGKRSAALGVTQCSLEITAAEVKHVQHAKQSRLVEYVAALFGDRQASVQGDARRVAFSVHLHGRNSEPRLKMHLLGRSVSSLIQGENGALRPAMTFSKQGHRQEDRSRGGGKSDANLGIAVGAETHHSRAARTLLRPAKWGARSVPVDKVNHSVPTCSSHRR